MTNTKTDHFDIDVDGIIIGKFILGTCNTEKITLNKG